MKRGRMPVLILESKLKMMIRLARYHCKQFVFDGDKPAFVVAGWN